MNITSKLRDALRLPSEQDRVRAYLDRSVSMADLERRQHEVDAGRFCRRRSPGF